MNKSILSVCNKIVDFSVNFKQICPISTTASCSLIQKYRKQKSLPLNPNSSGPLTDLPDFTYLNGKPTPLGMNQKRRMNKQIELTKKIITLSEDMDFAIQRHEEQKRDEQKIKDNILNNKLKPKGHLLLKQK